MTISFYFRAVVKVETGKIVDIAGRLTSTLSLWLSWFEEEGATDVDI